MTGPADVNIPAQGESATTAATKTFRDSHPSIGLSARAKRRMGAVAFWAAILVLVIAANL